MNFDKESKSRIFFFFFFGGGGVGGGGNYGRYEHESRHILYTRHIVTTSSTDDGIQTREHCSLNTQGEKSESMQARVVIPVCDTLS